MNTQIRTLVTALLAVVLLQESAAAQNGSYRLGEVLGLRYFTIETGDQSAFEDLAKTYDYPFYDANVPGADILLLKGDRGKRLGDYAIIINVNTLDQRNSYWPQEQPPHPRWQPIQDEWTSEVGPRYNELQYEGVFEGDFVLVGAETVPEMPWVDMLGIHHLNVKPGQEKAFERYITENWNPVSHFPGLSVLYFRADRGPRNGQYARVFVFEHRSLRDVYAPTPGTQSKFGAQVFEAYEAMWNEINERFLENPTTSEYTDFYMIR